MTDFEALLRTLAQNRVNFIIIGGAAATAHGSARLIQNLEIMYDRSPENLNRLVDALAKYKPYLRGAPPGLPFRWEGATLRNGLNFTLVTSLGAIDLLGEIPGGGDYDELKSGAVELQVFSAHCLCLSLPQWRQSRMKPSVKTRRGASSFHSSGISARSSARFSNLVNWPRNLRGTVPIGPFLCLAMIKSANPLRLSSSFL